MYFRNNIKSTFPMTGLKIRCYIILHIKELLLNKKLLFLFIYPLSKSTLAT